MTDESALGEEFDQALKREIKSIRERARRKRGRPDEPTSSWVEDEVLNGKETKALVIIFSTLGCFYAETSGCSMCGYTNESLSSKVTSADVCKQYDIAMRKYAPETKVLKIFTSGSFFDKREVPEEAQYELLKCASAKFEKVIVETRSEFVTDSMLARAKENAVNLELAIGLESSSDVVLKNSINKGSTFASFKNACARAKEHGVTIKAYAMIKPPFMTEREAYLDAVATAEDISGIENLTTISFNPVNVQAYTLIERFFTRGEYRPPWLWTVAKALRDSKEKVGDRIRVISSPTAGGTSRGAYNCSKCDEAVIGAIKRFSQKQEVRILDEILSMGCACKSLWEDTLELERFAQSSVPLER